MVVVSTGVALTAGVKVTPIRISGHVRDHPDRLGGAADLRKEDMKWN